jgi:molybdopterin biosynthesis enzyme
MGYQYIPETVYLESGEDFVRKKTDMESVIPVKQDDSNKIIKVHNNNSGNIFSLSEMYGILLFPEGTEIIKKGEMTKVILL